MRNNDPYQDHAKHAVKSIIFSQFYNLTLCMLGNFFHFFMLLSFADFFQNQLTKISFWNTIRVSNSLDPDQDRQDVGPDRLTNCLPRSSLAWNELISSLFQIAIWAKKGTCNFYQ